MKILTHWDTLRRSMGSGGQAVGREPRGPQSLVRLRLADAVREQCTHDGRGRRRAPHTAGVPAVGKAGPWAASTPHFLCSGHALWVLLSGVLDNCAATSPACRVPVCCASSFLKRPSPVGWWLSPQS